MSETKLPPCDAAPCAGTLRAYTPEALKRYGKERYRAGRAEGASAVVDALLAPTDGWASHYTKADIDAALAEVKGE